MATHIDLQAANRSLHRYLDHSFGADQAQSRVAIRVRQLFDSGHQEQS